MKQRVSLSIRPTWWQRLKILFGADVCIGCAYEAGEYWGAEADMWVGSIYDDRRENHDD